MSTIDVFTGPVGEDQVALLLQQVTESIKSNRSPLLLVPNRQIKQAVRRRLLRDLGQGWSDRVVRTLHEFIHEVADAAYGSEVREVLWWMLALRKVRENSALGQIKNYPHTLSAVSQTIRELSEGGIGPEELRGVGGGEFSVYSQLATLYEQALSAEIIPLQGAMKKAMGVLKSGPEIASQIGITGFFYFHHSQLEFISALSQACQHLMLTLPYEEVRPNVYGLTEENLSSLPPNYRTDLSRKKFVEDKPVFLLEADTIEEEVASIMVEVKSRLVSGLQPDQVAILMREPFRYEALFHRFADEFKVPISEVSPLPPASSHFIFEHLEKLPERAQIGRFLIYTSRIIESQNKIGSLLWRELRSTIDELEVHLEHALSVMINRDEWLSLWRAQRREREKGRTNRTETGVRLLDMQQPHWGGIRACRDPWACRALVSETWSDSSLC
ncbi:hypothetical protein ACFLRA_02175 [Bdellovibrionota bacterium]